MVKRCYSHIAYVSGLLLLVFLAGCSNNHGGSPSSIPQAALVGTWTGCAFLGFNGVTFQTDGTANLDNYVVNYKFDGTRVEFSSIPQNFIYTATEYSALLSSDHNLLTLTDTHGNFCVLARSSFSDEQNLLLSIVGAWTGDCDAYLVGDEEDVSFSHITFGANGTLTWDGILPGDTGGSTGMYTIPATVEFVSNDYSILSLQFENSTSLVFEWKISTDGKLLTLSQYGLAGDYSCSLARS